MLLIVACHTMFHLDWGFMSSSGWRLAVANTIVQGGQLGVAIFFMISGYFLVGKEFKPSRLVNAWIQVFTYGALILCFTLIIRGAGRLQFLDDVLAGWGMATAIQKELMPITSCAYWFMTAYFGLMLIAPFLNTLFSHMKKNAMLALTIGLALIESSFLLRWEAIQLSQLLKAITCYLIGGCIAQYPQTIRAKSVRSVVLLTVLCVAALFVFNYVTKMGSDLIAWLGWEAYWHDGPWVLWMLPAAGWLSLATNSTNKTPTPLASMVYLIASATFGVYLLHENYLGYRMLWRAVNTVIERPPSITAQIGLCALILIGVFALCTAIALLVDKIVVKPLQKQASKRLQGLDNRWKQVIRG